MRKPNEIERLLESGDELARVWEVAKPIAVKALGADFGPEAVGEVQTRLWESSHRYDASKSGIGTWVRRLSKDVASDRTVSAAAYQRAVSAVTEATESTQSSAVANIRGDSNGGFRGSFSPDVRDTGQSIEDFSGAEFTRADMVDAFEAMPPRRAEAVARFYFEDLSVSQIAEAMGVSVRATEDLLKFGKETLAEHLGGYAEDYGNAPTGTLPLVSQPYGGNGGRYHPEHGTVAYAACGPQDTSTITITKA